MEILPGQTEQAPRGGEKCMVDTTHSSYEDELL